MSEGLGRQVGAAVTWKSFQLGADRVVGLIRFIVLARLLSPDDFGLLAIATVTLDLLVTMTYFGMMPALVQRVDPQPRDYHAAWTVNVIRGAAVGAVVFITAPFVAQLFGDPRAVPLLQLIALRPLLSGFLSVRTADLRRELRFRRLAAIEVPPGVIQTVVAIALVPWLGVYALIAGMLAQAASHLVLSFALAPYRPRLTLGGGAARSLIRFGRWYLAMAVLGVAGEHVLRLLVSRMLGTVELGLFYLAARLVEMPVGVIGHVLREVAFPLHATLQEQRERAAQTFRANLAGLLVALLPVYIGLVALAPALIRDVLDARWDGAAGIMRVLALAMTFTIVRSAVQPMLEGRGRPQWATALDLVRTTTLLVAGWPLTAAFGLMGAGLAVAIAELPTQVLAALMARRLLPGPFRGVWRPLLGAASASAVAAGAALAVDDLVGAPFGFLAATATGVVVGGVCLLVLDRVLGARLAAQLLRVFPPLRRLPGVSRLDQG